MRNWVSPSIIANIVANWGEFLGNRTSNQKRWGDGITRITSAHLVGAINLTLEKVQHSPNASHHISPFPRRKHSERDHRKHRDS